MTESEDRVGREGGGADRAARMLAGDLDALRAVTARDLPPPASALAPTSSARGGAPAAHPEGILMNAWRNSRSRPWLFTALGTVAVALVLLVVPVSYNRLSGSELTLSLPNAELTSGAVREIAGDLRAKLGAEKVRIEADAAAGLTLTAEIPGASWRQVGKLAVDYARGLADRGIQASPRVRPRFETVQGNVYAAIGNMVEIRIETEGKSDQEIADEIRNQLLAAGMSDATVEVNRQDGRTEMRIEMQKTAEEGDSPDGACCPEFKVLLDGKEPGDPNTQQCKVRVKRTEGMTDQDVIDAVKRQLEEQGIVGAEVYYEGGRLQVQCPPK